MAKGERSFINIPELKTNADIVEIVPFGIYIKEWSDAYVNKVDVEFAILEFGFKPNLEASKLTIFVNIEMEHKDTKEILARIGVKTTFLIKEFKTLLERIIEDNHLYDLTIRTAFSLSMSCSRGVIAQILNGTYLNNAVLPLADAKIINHATDRSKEIVRKILKKE